MWQTTSWFIFATYLIDQYVVWLIEWVVIQIIISVLLKQDNKPQCGITATVCWDYFRIISLWSSLDVLTFVLCWARPHSAQVATVAAGWARTDSVFQQCNKTLLTGWFHCKYVRFLHVQSIRSLCCEEEYMRTRWTHDVRDTIWTRWNKCVWVLNDYKTVCSRLKMIWINLCFF